MNDVHNPVDSTWAAVARGARDAVVNLGYHRLPRCLPDEAEACGVGFAPHAAAYFATIKAIIDHQGEHLGPLADIDEIREIYRRTRDELAHADRPPADAT